MDEVVFLHPVGAEDEQGNTGGGEEGEGEAGLDRATEYLQCVCVCVCVRVCVVSVCVCVCVNEPMDAW